MSSRARAGLIGVIALLIVVGVSIWGARGMHRVTEWVDLPVRGEAAYNRLYGLQKALRATGHTVQSRRRLQLGLVSLGEHDTVVMLQDTLGLQAEETYELLDWVESGGHLVVGLSRTDEEFSRAGADATLTELLGVQRVVEDARVDDACLRFTTQGATPPAELFCYAPRFDLGQGEPVLGLRDAAGHWVMARIAHGEGSVDVLSSLEFAQGDRIEDPVSAMLMARLLAPNDGRGTVHLIYEPGLPSLWLVLLRKGWMAWAPALLALMAWLWWRAQRRGPLLPSVVQQRRSMVEHIRASGEHLWRHRRGDLLHQAERDRFLARLRLRDPVAASQEGTLQAEMIASLTDASPTAILRALQTPPPHDANALRERIALLIDLGKRL